MAMVRLIPTMQYLRKRKATCLPGTYSWKHKVERVLWPQQRMSECKALSSSRRRPLPLSCIWLAPTVPQFTDEDDREGRVHLQQDGAPSLYFGEVREHLSTCFPDRWIGRAALTPRSQDLTPLDWFFLMGICWKIECSYHLLPANVVEFRTQINATVAEVTPKMLRRTQNVARNWLQVGRLPHYQWKSQWT
jgi:hypothetical protein